MIGGLAHGAKNTLLRTLIHEHVPAAFPGRAAACNALRNGAELLALGTGGAMVAELGGRTTMSLSGALPMTLALAAVAGLWLRASQRSQRKGGPFGVRLRVSDGDPERVGADELGSPVFVEGIDLIDREARASQKRNDPAGQMAASEDPLLDGLETMLPTPHALIGRESVLDEVKRAP